MLDILADLEGQAPRGRCRIQDLRQERPDLAAQWDRLPGARHSAALIAKWFSGHGFSISE